MKKMKKVIAAAIAMMSLSTAAAVTGTVAWFTASNVVTAQGIYVQAEKEDGIVMANEAHHDWSTVVTASHDGQIANPKAGQEGQPDTIQAGFIPTSTLDASNWAHASAIASNDELASDASYSMVTPTLNGSGTGVYKTTINGADKNIYLVNGFYLKSASTSPIEGDLYSYVKAEVVGTSASVELNKALRVLVKYDTAINIYAPIDGATTGYQVCTAVAANVPTKTSIAAANGVFAGQSTHLLKSAVTIPANVPGNPDSVTSFYVEVFVYFEGEDEACFSDNITATLDKLSIIVKLGTQNNLA